MKLGIGPTSHLLGQLFPRQRDLEGWRVGIMVLAGNGPNPRWHFMPLGECGFVKRNGFAIVAVKGAIELAILCWSHEGCLGVE